MKNFRFSARPIAFGEPGAKQSQDENPHQMMRLARTVSVDIAFGATCRFTVAAGERSPQLSRCLRGSSPPRPSPLGLSDSVRRFDGSHLVAARSDPSRQTLTTPRRFGIASTSGDGLQALRQSGETRSAMTAQTGMVRRMSTRSAQPRRPYFPHGINHMTLITCAAVDGEAK